MGFGLADIPIVGGMFDGSDSQALAQKQAALAEFQNLKTPNFKNYDPVLEQYLGNYAPSQAQANTINEDPTGRSAELSALNKMAGLSNTGLSDVDNAGFERARQQGNQMLSSGNAAALQNAQSRGVGGSGLEFAMREMANQQGAENSQNAGLAQAAQSANMRALYNQAFGNLGSQIRGQDYNTQASNAGILNNFNMYNTGNNNQAQLRNVNEMQGISNQNVGQQNYAQTYNNSLQQQNYDDAYRKAAGMAGQYQNVADSYYKQGAANDANRGALTQALGTGLGAAFGGSTGAKAGSQYASGLNADTQE